MPPSSHPFLTDQTPYLDRRFSATSLRSTSSAGSYHTNRSSSSSASALPHDPCWPFHRGSASGPSSRGAAPPPVSALQPSAPIYPSTAARTSQPVSRTQAYSHLSVASTRSVPTSSSSSHSPRSAPLPITPSSGSSTSSSSSPMASPTTPVSATIDRSCLVWMREAEQHEYLFGSVASRDTSPREIHRRLLHPDELAEHVEELRVVEDMAAAADRPCRLNLKCRNRGQRF
ncbi:uncharacterized protein LOC62_01G001437 [Vanrija pseudolonga]|uniref:Uncharacterized protein n=1 Tax=Vanrija pseudolonga TaxID=143232 RepID=A0AAF0Y1Z2_9TREE|nr:hypothetical protein LOC62_01G001437 [Vanrija pseudolonga]